MIKKINEEFKIANNEVVKVIDCGNVKEIIYVDKVPNNLKNFKRISKDTILNTATGEVITIENSVTRKDNIKSLRETIKRLRRLINANFEGAKNELFITLTYAENMTDYKRLYRDFELFYKRLKRKYKDIEFRYIYVVEPQDRGAWHVHMLLKAINKDYLYIENSVIAELWTQGFCKTQRLDSVDDVGAYLSAYLTDVICEDGSKCKGARLYLYPSGINIYRSSRNCKKPDEKYMKYGDIEYKNCKTYEVLYEVLDKEEKHCNYIKKEFYNLKRSKKIFDK